MCHGIDQGPSVIGHFVLVEFCGFFQATASTEEQTPDLYATAPGFVHKRSGLIPVEAFRNGNVREGMSQINGVRGGRRIFS